MVHGIRNGMAAVAVVLAASAAAAQAQTKPSDYPKRPVRFIVAQLAGGNADFVARLFDGETAQAASGDAPYNLKIAGDVFGLGKRTHEEFVMGSGEVAMAEFEASSSPI